jgi:hypothetical protein
VFLIALALLPARVSAGVFSEMQGSAGLGYSKLFATDAPGGSISVSAGLDFPLAPDLRWGGAVAFHILGSRGVVQGSLAANVDYSAFEAALLAHYSPPWPGPIGRISAGPAVMSARAELSTSGGGAAFRRYAVEEIVPAAAFGVTLHRRSPAPVRVGLELSGRWGFLEDDDWWIASARLAFLY